MRKTKEMQNGITLIALVITIIILLILAGISIMSLTNTGLFGKAQEAKTKTKMADAKDAIMLTLNEWQMEHATSDTTLEAFFNEKVKSGELSGFEENEGTEGEYKVSKDGYYVVINSNGEIVENIAKEGPKPQITNIKITTDGTTEAADNSQPSGTKLKINFDTSIEGGTIKSVTPAVPYETNGTETEVTFKVVGTVGGDDFETTRTISVASKYKVSKYTAATMASATNKSEIYGKSVSYTPAGVTTDVGWKIFYSDGTNIYLIADNYVERDALPASTKDGVATANKPNAGNDSNGVRTAYFTNELNDYTGSASITTTKLQKLNNSFFSQGFTSTNNNMKSVAYMMDTTAWGGYKDAAGKAEYVIGGPTIEMVMNSYSQSHNVQYQAKATSGTGYQISKDNGENWATYYSGMLSTSDSLYVISSQSNAKGMWVASPSAYRSNCVLSVNCYGSVINYYSSDTPLGFRPLVCLNSNVTLQEANGTYTIQ